MSYPDKFKIKDRSDGGVVDVKKVDDGYSFTYQRTGFENFFCKESAESIIKNFYTVVQEGPEMVFPFKYKHCIENQVGTVHKWEDGAVDGMLKVVIFDVEDGEYHECYDWMEEDAKRWIKDGTWIVTSVGEPKKPSSIVIEELVVKVNSDGVELATERLTKLAEAAEAVNISLESMQQLLSEIGGVKAAEAYDGKLFVTTECVNPVHDYDSFDIEKFLKGK